MRKTIKKKCILHDLKMHEITTPSQKKIVSKSHSMTFYKHDTCISCLIESEYISLIHGECFVQYS